MGKVRAKPMMQSVRHGLEVLDKSLDVRRAPEVPGAHGHAPTAVAPGLLAAASGKIGEILFGRNLGRGREYACRRRGACYPLNCEVGQDCNVPPKGNTMSFARIGLGPTEMLIILLVLSVFWIWMLIDCLMNPRLQGTEKIVWVLVIIFLHWIGAAIYYFVGRRR